MEAERALAAACGEEHAVSVDLGVRWSGGAPLPHLLSSGHRTFVAFYLDEPDPDWDGTYVHVVDPMKLRRRLASPNSCGAPP